MRTAFSFNLLRPAAFCRCAFAAGFTFFLFLFSVGVSAQQTPGESFIGVHYSGLIYRSEHNQVQPWNSGFGFTAHLGMGPHFGIEGGLDRNYIRETHGRIDSMTHSMYTALAYLASFRICLTETRATWSGQLFIGIGPVGTATVQHKKFYDDHVPVTHGHGGPDRFLPQVGIRYSRRLTPHLNIYVAAVSAVKLRGYEFTGGHFTRTYYDPLQTRLMLWANAGIAYRGILMKEPQKRH